MSISNPDLRKYFRQSRNYGTSPSTYVELEETAMEESPFAQPKSFSERGVKLLNERYGIPWPPPPLPPARELLKMSWEELKNNWKSGLTVALVSIPLSISLAVAAQASPGEGITTAIWAGGLCSLLGGSSFNIVGPTGALSGLLASNQIKYEELNITGVLPFLALLGGLACIIVWLLRLDRYFVFIPGAVTHGFTVGVAIIIALNQLQFLLGLPPGLPRHEHFYKNVYVSFEHIGETNGWAFLFFIVNFILLMTALHFFPKLPWAIVIAGGGILFGALMETGNFPIKLQTLSSRYGDMKLELFNVPYFDPKLVDTDTLNSALSVAFIAVLETLISAKIADRLSNTQFNQPRECFALGIGNIFCGIFNGIPATAALARTSLNVKSGATSRISGLIACLTVLLVCVFLLQYFKYLLLPVVGSILFVVAYRMIEWEPIFHLWKNDKFMFLIASLVVIVVVIMGPTEGLIFGSIISLLMFASYNSKGYGEFSINKGSRMVYSSSTNDLDKYLNEVESELQAGARDTRYTIEKKPMTKMVAAEEYGDTLVYRIPGELTYLNAQSHIDRTKKIASHEYKYVILAMRYLFYLDLDGLDSLSEIVQDFEHHGKVVLLSSVCDDVRSWLVKAKWYNDKVGKGYVFMSTKEALDYVDKLREEAEEAAGGRDGDDGMGGGMMGGH